MELHPGQVAVLRNDDITIGLINESKITPIGKVAYKIHSKILGDDLWIVATDKELQELVGEGITEVIYTQGETNKLMKNNVSKEELIKIHNIKKFFPGATVENIGSEQREN